MSWRPRFSTLVAGALVLVAVLLAATAVLLDYSGGPHGGKIVVTVRIWADQIAAAYRQSFEAFTRAHPDIEVHTNMVAYSTYFNTLRTDVAGGSADDIFWLSNAYLAAYADSGRLMKIEQGRRRRVTDWEPAVVDQFTRGGVLWGVPQLTDAGIALYYNADLLAAAGVDPAQLNSLRWSPNGDDTLRPMLARLTVDADGNAAGTPGFDGGRVRQWGYNAANDPQGIYLNYIGSAGGVFQRGDEFAFDNPAGDRGLPLSGRSDQRRPRRAAGVGHQRQRRLLPQPVSGRPDGALPVRHLQPGAGGPRRPLPLGCGDAARRSRGPGKRHQWYCRGWQFGVQTPGCGASGVGLDGQQGGQRISGPPRCGHPRGAVGSAGLLRLLGRQGHRRHTVLHRAGRPAHSGPGRRRIRRRGHGAAKLFRRNVPRPRRRRGDPATGSGGGQRRRAPRSASPAAPAPVPDSRG